MPLPHYGGRFNCKNLSKYDLIKLIKDVVGIEPIDMISDYLIYEQNEYINSKYFKIIGDSIYDIKLHMIEEFKKLKNVIRLKKINSL